MATELLPRKPGERKQARVIIDAEGRDKDKAFILTEMSADAIERWFRRVLAYLARVGIAAPTLSNVMGMASFGSFNPIQMFAWLDDESLNVELMTCVQRQQGGSTLVRPLTWNRTGPDIEEMLTLAQLKVEVLGLHVGFSTAVVLWKFAPGLAAALNLAMPAEMTPAPPDTPTSPTQ